MKISELIEQVRTEKPNSFLPDKLTEFINGAEAEVATILGLDVIPKYTYNEDSGKELLAPAPYDMLYKAYLKAQIDYSNEELESYANNQAQYSQSIAEYTAYVVREGKSKTTIPVRFKNIF